MKNEPLISVLIPVYNRETFIGDCIRSALNQTWQKLEVVVVDNASTDGTYEICRDLAHCDDRVRVFRNETNLGPVRNWQRCIEEARGSFGKILFSDDLMAPEYLEKTLPLLKEEVGFVFSSIDIGDHPGSSAAPYWWRLGSGTWPSSTFIEESLLGGKLPVSPGAGLFRLEDLKRNLVLDIPTLSDIDFTRYGAGPDVLLYLLTAADYPRIAYLAEPLVFFRSHPDSITLREDDGMIASHYYQAKLWFARKCSRAGSSVFGSLLQKTLVHGWLLQTRRKVREPLADFTRRQVESPPSTGWTVIVAVRLYRLKLRYQRSLWRFWSKLTRRVHS